MPSPNDVIEKKVVQAYIQSNAFWPQSRASFVLVMFSILDEEALRWLRDASTLAVSESSITLILRAADRLHSEYNVSTVIPAKQASVDRELRQSVKVARRTLSEIEQQADGELDLERLRQAASDLWNGIYREEPLSEMRLFIGTGSKESTFAVKEDISERPETRRILDNLRGNCSSTIHHHIITALLPEIVQPINVIRNRLDDGSLEQKNQEH